MLVLASLVKLSPVFRSFELFSLRLANETARIVIGGVVRFSTQGRAEILYPLYCKCWYPKTDAEISLPSIVNISCPCNNPFKQPMLRWTLRGPQNSFSFIPARCGIGIENGACLSSKLSQAVFQKKKLEVNYPVRIHKIKLFAVYCRWKSG